MLRSLAYLSVLSLPVLMFIGLSFGGAFTFLPLIEAFLLVPFLELLIPPSHENLSSESEDRFERSRLFDLILYVFVPLHFLMLGGFFLTISNKELLPYETLGLVFSMGLMNGVFGINLAHELGHRKNSFERFMAKALLMTSLYMHFNIEHNRGHHKNVATPGDPSSARMGEVLYFFWFRSVFNTWSSAWKLESERLARNGKNRLSVGNEMLRIHFIYLVWLASIFFAFGYLVLTLYMASAIIGFLLLETVNYIEHYGLIRRKTESGSYERVSPRHSWNSDHRLGRTLLFELSRHSDHHFKASRKYQILRYHEGSPQMPTGYPGMMIMALIPPIWFSVMNKKARNAAEV